MKTRTIELITSKLGPPEGETKKAFAWNITSGFGVVVQQDQPLRDEYAIVWLPFNNDLEALPSIEKSVYPPEKGRHSNTYASPGLTKGEPAVRLKIRSQSQLNELTRYLFEF
ncbi:hypothetical protein VIN01S_22230 [Vibrio inusitatus NBRC 102082]|uniref:Uncharacterized protein n=1 Tax=Vibrio inusitatus NBRC 102082 TaxID=1219070 RepID=A0A4Y3HW69_9VIBR|nr:hypothetical protein [Vibrio inusitatus]GEA51419.1 hypothetical protein VIN01S_22230 [Vibrio inusitatus NBRC 102082]